MRTRLLLAVAVLLWASVASAADVWQQVMVTPGPEGVRCVGGEREYAEWNIPADLGGKTVIIRRVEIWIGTNGGEPFPAVDVHTNVFLYYPQSMNRPRMTLAYFGLDHYKAFTGPHQLDKPFTPEQAPTAPAGSRIVLSHLCNEVSPVPAYSRTQAIISITVD